MRDSAARRLLVLLGAQRLAERERDRHARSSAEWEAASDRLEALNVRIWQLASSGAEPADDLDAEPEEALLRGARSSTAEEAAASPGPRPAG